MYLKEESTWICSETPTHHGLTFHFHKGLLTLPWHCGELCSAHKLHL